MQTKSKVNIAGKGHVTDSRGHVTDGLAVTDKKRRHLGTGGSTEDVMTLQFRSLSYRHMH